jgi:hypothetical protein
VSLLTIPEYDFSTESDVEQKFIMPLLTHPSFLEIPSRAILTKKSMRVLPFVDKSALPKGYIPDYIVFFNGYPILVVEAKPPEVAIKQAIDEARMRGAGKSLFIYRFFTHLMPEELKARAAWCIIDFNRAPSSIDNIETFICEKFVEECQNLQFDLYSLEGLNRVFAVEINRLQRGPLAVITDEAEKQRVLSTELLRLSADKRNFGIQLGRSLTSNATRPLIVAFDNVDRRESAQQAPDIPGRAVVPARDTCVHATDPSRRDLRTLQGSAATRCFRADKQLLHSPATVRPCASEAAAARHSRRSAGSRKSRADRVIGHAVPVQQRPARDVLAHCL